MSAKFILIQAVGFLGTILYFFSCQCKSNKKLFQTQLVSYICYTLHLFLLGATTGGISYILNMIRSFCLGSENAFLKSRIMCGILCMLQVATLFFTIEKWWSVLPVMANIAATIGGYTHNGLTFRVVGMFVNSPLWVIYDVIVGSWAGILDEVACELSMAVSIVRYGWKTLDSTE